MQKELIPTVNEKLNQRSDIEDKFESIWMFVDVLNLYNPEVGFNLEVFEPLSIDVIDSKKFDLNVFEENVAAVSKEMRRLFKCKEIETLHADINSILINELSSIVNDIKAYKEKVTTSVCAS